MVRIPTHRTPTHPGEMLLEEFLRPMELTQRDLADAIGVPFRRMNEIIERRREITPGTAMRLGQFLGTTSEFWLNGQMRWDLYHARRSEGVD
jgi:addiction module HigA family antidote